MSGWQSSQDLVESMLRRINLLKQRSDLREAGRATLVAGRQKGRESSFRSLTAGPSRSFGPRLSVARNEPSMVDLENANVTPP